jgi:hypothetical protein
MESPEPTAAELRFADTLRLSPEIEIGSCPTVNLKPRANTGGATGNSFAVFHRIPRFMPVGLPRANFRSGSCVTKRRRFKRLRATL